MTAPALPPAGADTDFAVSGRCESCRWLDTSTQSSHAEPDTTGLCRRRPPGHDDRTGRAVWPFVDLDDWCGDWVSVAIIGGSGA